MGAQLLHFVEIVFIEQFIELFAVFLFDNCKHTFKLIIRS